MFKNAIFFCCFILNAIIANAQVLGGLSTYNFLKLSTSPQVSALGGNVVAIINDDANLGYQNPALLNSNQSGVLSTNINFMYGGIKNLFASYSKYNSKLDATYNTSVNFINYGSIDYADDAGNINGTFKPSDYVIQFGFSKKYLTKWQYGGNLKFIGSTYAGYSSYATAFDFGTTYFDSSKLLKVGIVFKNIGVQLKKYNSASKEDLPFDMQIGISKKLQKAPLQFIFTATNLHQFNIRYADTLFENELNSTVKKGKFTMDKLFRHLTIAAQLYPTKNTELTIAYNYLRRKELGLFNIGTGVTGFSFGAGILFNAYQVRFAKAFYQNTKAYNQIGLQVHLDKLYH